MFSQKLIREFPFPRAAGKCLFEWCSLPRLVEGDPGYTECGVYGGQTVFKQLQTESEVMDFDWKYVESGWKQKHCCFWITLCEFFEYAWLVDHFPIEFEALVFTKNQSFLTNLHHQFRRLLGFFGWCFPVFNLCQTALRRGRLSRCRENLIVLVEWGIRCILSVQWYPCFPESQLQSFFFFGSKRRQDLHPTYLNFHPRCLRLFCSKYLRFPEGFFGCCQVPQKFHRFKIDQHFERFFWSLGQSNPWNEAICL